MREKKKRDYIISIIIPTYNRANLLERAIQSVLDQTYEDFELIVVDDASTDNTREVVEKFSDSRIKYLEHEKNQGGSAARNTGIKKATGEFVAFLDSDDEWLPTKLEKQMNLITRDRKIGLVYTGIIVLNQDREVLRKRKPKFRGDLFKKLFEDNVIGSTSTALVRSECFEKVGKFDEDLPARQDWDLWVRLAEKYKIDFVPDLLLKYYRHDNSITSNKHAKIFAFKRILKKYEAYLKKPKMKSEYASILFNIGKLYCYIGQSKRGKLYLRRSFLNDYNMKPLLHFLLASLGNPVYQFAVKLHRLAMIFPRKVRSFLMDPSQNILC